MRSDLIITTIEAVTKRWATQRKREEKEQSARHRRAESMYRQRTVHFTECADAVLPDAWAKASGNGSLPASARQIYYAARVPLFEMTGREIKYSYFSGTLLPNYIEENGLDWDVIYDARGTYFEPHGKTSVAIGTLQVRHYLESVSDFDADAMPRVEISREYPTTGPENRFGAILFVEKEGFKPLLDAAKIAERFDIAIMSTKGMSVTASRLLIETLCADHDIPLPVLHDFDVSGFTIAGTLQRDTRRYQFSQSFKVIDLGLRFEDIDGLESERVYFEDKADLDAKAATLRRHGATREEINFLLRRQQRVELNAMTSPQFIAFLERKLIAAGIGKIVPDAETMKLAASRAARIAHINKVIADLGDEDYPVPDDIESKVRAIMQDKPELPWDLALIAAMDAELDDDADGDSVDGDDDDWQV